MTATRCGKRRALGPVVRSESPTSAGALAGVSVRLRQLSSAVPACGVPNRPQPHDDPVLARRARISRLVALGQRLGYSLWLVAIVVFVVGAVTGFHPAMVTIVIGCLAAGSALLAPSIVIGYGVRAADREDQGLDSGH